MADLTQIVESNVRALERKLELNNPVNREIINQYAFEEKKYGAGKLYEIIQEEYPSMSESVNQAYNAMMNESNKKSDFLDDVKVLHEYIRAVELIKAKTSAGAAIKPEMQKVYDYLTEFTKKVSEFFPVHEQILIQKAYAAKDIARREAITPVQTVSNLKYRDEITRKLFPNRKDAESYYNKSMLTLIECVEIIYKAAQDPEIAKHAQVNIEEMKSSLPEEETLEMIFSITKKYINTEINRIYSKRD
ncbi:MAG TPA: hypothetical protein VEC16_02505 [Alphaproteobacteria bacterium]|nr:hypothetical protein [Alphaproteobacteria bacterium]